MEYEVPRSLDVPDRLGIPFFTTVQFAIAISGVLLMVGIWKLLGWFGMDVFICAWTIYIPLTALLLPRQVDKSGWTLYRLITARVGRWCRPRRAIWRPT